MKNKHFDHKHYSAKYVNRYFGLNCSSEMQELKLFPNIKEIQESFAMYDIVENYVLNKDPDIKRDSTMVNVYVIGDGHTPRTGAVFAFMTKWFVTSIDPNMRDEKYKKKVRRLVPIKDVGENIEKYLLPIPAEFVILVFPHSHIHNTNDVYKHFKDQKVWIINMPCCYQAQDDTLPLTWSVSYRDKAIDTAHNTIRVYCNYLNLT